VLTLIVGLLFTGGAEKVSAANFDENTSYVLINKNSGKVLDVFDWSTADDGELVQWDRNDLAVQQWKIKDAGSGYFQIESLYSGKLVYVKDKSKTDGPQNVQMRPRSSQAHDWKIELVSNGYYKIINKNSGKALEVYEHSTQTGANITQWEYHGADNQLWQI